MAEPITSMEVTAQTIEEAIENGLAEMALSIDDVDIDYLDEGSKGLFGFGGRLARIRITKKGCQPINLEKKPLPAVEETVKESAPEAATKPARAEAKPAKKEKPAETSSMVEEPELRVARETVSELLEEMHIHAQVTSTFSEVADDKDLPGVLVEITGPDLSVLIGRRSETLNALQYISSLIIGKRLEKWLPLMIDVEGYRQRRERQLHQLATRIADQVTSSGKRQALEPMPANERRVIHLALRDHPAVITESTGEEPYRKVVILPKK
jgi:spoIIIJ-associated protein